MTKMTNEVWTDASLICITDMFLSVTVAIFFLFFLRRIFFRC